MDRISSLPDDVLRHILSFLLTIQAAQTTIFSRRWRHLFSSVQTLHFDLRDFTNNQIPSATIDLRGHAPVLSFRASLHLPGPKPRYRDPQIDLALLPARQIGLCINTQFPLGWFVSFRTETEGGKFYKTLNGVWFRSLKSLYLTDMVIPELESLMASCPVVEDLRLERCRCDTFNIRSVSLKSLVMVRCRCHGGEMVVSAPNLVSLDIDNPWCGIVLEDTQSVIRASLNCPHKIGVKNLNALKNVSVLILHHFQPEVLYEEDSSPVPLTTFSNLKSLTINSCLPSIKVHAKAILTFLHHSPILENLVTDLSIDTMPKCKGTKCERGTVTCQPALSHLKVVELRNFGTSRAEVELLNYISKNKVTERITVLRAK